MERVPKNEYDLNFEATELRLALPGRVDTQKGATVQKSNKRPSEEAASSGGNSCVSNANSARVSAPPAKTQVVGWPPVRSYRKNCLQQKKHEDNEARMYVKVSVDGAPYLRKIDLKFYRSYPELMAALQSMFKLTIGEYSEREGYRGSEYAPTYEDKDGDWMLVGDVPWEMFVTNCRRLRIMKRSEDKGLGCP